MALDADNTNDFHIKSVTNSATRIAATLGEHWQTCSRSVCRKNSYCAGSIGPAQQSAACLIDWTDNTRQNFKAMMLFGLVACVPTQDFIDWRIAKSNKPKSEQYIWQSTTRVMQLKFDSVGRISAWAKPRSLDMDVELPHEIIAAEMALIDKMTKAPGAAMLDSRQFEMLG